MKKFPTVKCPYCFETLKYNDAVFRCDSGFKHVDEHLRSFHYANGNEAFEREDYDFIDPADLTYQQINFDDEKHITGVKNPNLAMSQPLQQRLCPYCHNNLLKSFGKKETRYIAVIGVPNSGKTTYLAAVNHSLRNKIWNWNSLNSEKNSPLDDVTDKYSANVIDSNVATKSIQGPYFYSLNFSDDNGKNSMDSHIVFFDVPGEFYSNADKITYSLEQFLKNADGIIFIVNSAEEVEYNKYLQEHDFKKMIKIDDILSAFEQVDIIKKKKTAIIFNKIDLIQDKIGLDPNLNIFPPVTNETIDAQQVDILSQNTISLILGDGSAYPSSTQVALSRYMRKIRQVFGRDCRVFATKLMTEDVNNPGRFLFNSQGAETPFLWLLSEIGVFPKSEPKK